MSREELFHFLVDNVESPEEIGAYLTSVDQILLLQNDVRRPAYIFQMEHPLSQNTVDYLQTCMTNLGVCACLVPSKVITPVGKVTPESMGDRNIKEIIYSVEGAKDGGQEDGAGAVDGRGGDRESFIGKCKHRLKGLRRH